MHPKKSKELIPRVASELDLSEKTIEDITNFYWREVWVLLTNPSDVKVHIENLGDFNVKHWLLDKEIDRIDNPERKTRLKDKVKFVVNKKLSERSSILKNLKILIQEEEQRKEFIYEHKKIVYEKSSKTDLE